MIIGYARVSTQDQSYEAQIEALKQAGCTRIYSEKVSGKTRDFPGESRKTSKTPVKHRHRPELARLLEQLRPDDILVVTKLDRLARSLSDLISIIAELKQVGAGFKSLGEGFDLSSPAGRMQMGIVAVFAEFERDIIVQRTNEGLAHARAQGRIGGRRPALSDLQRKELIERVLRGDLSIPQVGKIYGVSRATVNRIMKKHRESLE